jgi:hypothetical protein
MLMTMAVTSVRSRSCIKLCLLDHLALNITNTVALVNRDIKPYFICEKSKMVEE